MPGLRQRSLLSVRADVGLQDGVDLGLVALSLAFEPVQDVPVDTDRDQLLGLGQPQGRCAEEILVQLGDLRGIDLIFRQSGKFPPVSAGLFFRIGLSHTPSPFARK